MRKKIVAGNWKMNLTFSEAEDLLFDLNDELISEPPKAGVEVIIFPPYPYLELAADAAEEGALMFGAQNCADHDKGAYTGEVSAAMLNSIDATHVIIGHSERRKYYHEDSAVLYNKIRQALDNDLIPVFCCGENLEDRESNNHFNVVKQQIEEVLFKLEEEEFSLVIIAYEPVWAIGTGKTATSEQAQEMHAFIRSLIAKQYPEDVAEETIILYGGSCNPKNAKELFACPDVDGGLIGGASLKKDDFIAIVRSC
ncbi:MAG: triose-phosphate isomerase [Bacteroidales bacterium]|jgi:triosephosphate isomerase (TIM)|nr:triose-phosphate isomerase [Bacteroidales bacterium]MDD3152627.1 triose-phosphate isomerase [Bacteroidales bacterium]MDD3914198.1 triose-phosphate isomerase [Bacteroidales bacterium]MDD4634631.1 triose-phosphate isomerase [Bacteroidales bacterium]